MKEKKPFKCDLCNTSFAQSSGKNTHKTTVHDSKKPFKCDICHSCFSQKSSQKATKMRFMRKRDHSNVKHVEMGLLEEDH